MPAAPLLALPRIPYLRLRVTLRALAPAALPPFHGSMLRGAFGHALRRAACTMGPAQPCPTCRLRRACAHSRLFEALIDGSGREPPPFLRGLPTAPRPYLFEPGSAARSLAPGGELPFDLLLFGQAVDLLAYSLVAVERMAAAGLGRGRAPFELLHVRCPGAAGEWRDVFTAGRGLADGEPPVAVIPPGPAGQSAGLYRAATMASTPVPLSVGVVAGRGVIRFLTPARFKVRHQLARAVTFRGLAFAMLRRVLEVAHFHVPGAAVDWTIRPLLEHAGTVRLVASDLYWRDWERYSARQETRMALGGLVGSLEVEGDLTPFEPLLAAAEVLHVGKGTTFGLGRLEWRPGR